MATASQRLVTEAALATAISGASKTLTGTGSPEGVVTASEGALYIDTSDAAVPERRIYVKRQGSTSTGWAMIAGTLRYNVTSLATNVTSGTVTLILHGAWAGLQFASVVPAAAGTVDLFPSSGSALAPFVPTWSQYNLAINRASGGTTRQVLVTSSGRVAVLSAATSDLLDGIWWSPMMRTIPTTMPGTEI